MTDGSSVFIKSRGKDLQPLICLNASIASALHLGGLLHNAQIYWDRITGFLITYLLNKVKARTQATEIASIFFGMVTAKASITSKRIVSSQLRRTG